MKYRSDVDGLRALAVVPVIFYHAGFAHFEGGFVGVDIFFVISGYLITSILLREIEEGSFSLIDFYERRARRILPALVLVVAACIPAALIIMTPAQVKDFAQSVIAVSVFLSNVFFWQETGYFEVASELKPLLHTWSLAVEEQFYIFFPIFLMVVFAYRRRALVPFMIVLALMSLALSEWGWRNAPSGNFFLAPSRVWELLVGSLCAVITRHSITANEWLPAVGIAMIAASITVFDETTPFPSLYTLLPVVGTAFVILFSDPKTIIGRFLSLPLFVGIGLISYSAYLWHQPLFAFARLELGREPSVQVYIGLIVLTFALSFLSWRYVETPFRSRSGARAIARRGVFTSAGIASVGMLTFGTWGHLTDGWRAAYLAQLPVDQSVIFRLAEQARKEHGANSEGRFDDGACVFDANSFDDALRMRLVACAETHGPGVLVLGDSHAIDLYGAVIEGERFGEPFIAGIVSGGCRPHTPGPDCAYDQVAEFIAAEPNIFDIIVYTQAGFYLLRGDGFASGHRSMFQKFEPHETLPQYSPNYGYLSIIRDYLEVLAAFVPVVWLTPRIEPHLHTDYLIQHGCNHAFNLRPGTEAIFVNLEEEIAELLAVSEVTFLSQNKLLNLSFPEDLLSCEALYWSDGDHFSNAGEQRFGQRMRILENARRVIGR